MSIYNIYRTLCSLLDLIQIRSNGTPFMYDAYVEKICRVYRKRGTHGVCKTVRHSLFVCAVSIVAVQYKRFYIFIISIAESYTKHGAI